MSDQRSQIGANDIRIRMNARIAIARVRLRT